MRAIEEFCCQDIGCPDYGKRAALREVLHRVGIADLILACRSHSGNTPAWPPSNVGWVEA